ncbi:MAG: class I SAM-dependent methyltransferase [Gemmatimonadetes bacterium]|nr:class I SAM-dependent methyltransferase [Gemmatimonadota bacterium]MYG83957.1 class I SAM-dependent methyltransferase [Gemmatimonadota bacterium]MYJ91145.1 class I SAM-dependent methyltransferase [Gemmatimonadota bacterium]
MDSSEDYLGRWNDPAYARNYSKFTRDQQVDARKFIDQLEVDRNSIVVDLGCGEAKFLAAISPCIHTGIGIDASAHMLASARRSLTDLEIGNIELIHADFREFDVGFELADAVMSNYAIHHVPDVGKEEVFRRVHATLRSGGIFRLEDDSFNFPQEEFEERVPEIMTQWECHFGPEGWKFLKEKLAGDDFENTPYLDDLRRMIERSGLTVDNIVMHGLNGVEITARKP